MTMTRNGLNLGLRGSAVPKLESTGLALAGQALEITASRTDGLGFLAAFVRSRELRRRIKFAAQTQAHRLGWFPILKGCSPACRSLGQSHLRPVPVDNSPLDRLEVSDADTPLAYLNGPLGKRHCPKADHWGVRVWISASCRNLEVISPSGLGVVRSMRRILPAPSWWTWQILLSLARERSSSS